MPWVRGHRRSAPYSLFRSTTVRGHYRRPPGGDIVAYAIVAIVVILVLIVLL